MAQREVGVTGVSLTERARRVLPDEARGLVISSEPDVTLSRSEIFDVLRNDRRRAVICVLYDRGGEATISELTRAVAAEEFGKRPDELSSTEYKRVYTGLYQCHFERMEDIGVIDVDRTSGTVRLRDAAAQLRPHLADPSESERALLEGGVVGCVSLVIGVGLLGLGPFDAMAPGVWGYLLILVLLSLAALHYIEASR